jgi:CelD/BcsL family acetyltransferase involved in cellulose biosynthesis
VLSGSASSGVTIVMFDDLTPTQLSTWSTLYRARPELDSPYFHPRFAAAVHRSGHPVVVAVDHDATGAVRALLPVHRRGSSAVPVGSPAADFQGVIRAPGTLVDPMAILTALGVRQLSFDHLADGHDEFAPWVTGERPSPYLDVSGGMDGYLGRASRSGRDNMAQARRRIRKAERELGPVRFTASSTDPGHLDQLIELKRGQYAATGARDYFADPRHRGLVHDLLSVQDADFGGLLSTVHAGDRLLAAHFGMRAGGVLHWWFPVYDPGLGHLAPGWILLRELVEHAPELDLSRIELGRGEDEYKRRAMTGSTTVRQAVITRGGMRRELARIRTATVAAVRASPVGPGLRSTVHRLRRLAGTR